MVANVIAQCSCVNSPVGFVYPAGASGRSPYKIYILERDARVLPFGTMADSKMIVTPVSDVR